MRVTAGVLFFKVIPVLLCVSTARGSNGRRQIVNQIVRRFKANRQADHAIGNAELGALLQVSA